MQKAGQFEKQRLDLGGSKRYYVVGNWFTVDENMLRYSANRRGGSGDAYDTDHSDPKRLISDD
jgi:hypothetical protein